MIRIVLVRTAGARNAGLAARAVANFGPAEMTFVAPADPSIFGTCEYYEMAHGVKNARIRFPVVDSLDAALSGVTESIGFTARMRRHRSMEDFDAIADELAERASDPDQTIALVFGNEADGLTGEESAKLRRLAHIRTSKEQPSLNLGVAVAVVLSRLFRGEGAKVRSRRYRPLPAEKTDRLIAHLKPALLGLVRGESSKRDLEESIERIFRRAPLETRDARAWHRLARAVLGELGGDDSTAED